MGKAALRVERRTAAAVPPTRGPLLSAETVARDPELYNGLVTPKWVREHVPGKVKLGHRTVAWHRNDVLAHLERCRAQSQGAA